MKYWAIVKVQQIVEREVLIHTNIDPTLIEIEANLDSVEVIGINRISEICTNSPIVLELVKHGTRKDS